MTLANEASVTDAIIASTSHPLFKLQWLEVSILWGSSSHQDSVKNIMIQVIENLAEGPEAESSSGVSDSDDYFGFTKPTQTRSTADLELFSYLQDSNKTLQSLNRYPNIKKLFIKYNTTLPSSAPVERLFSLGGLTLSPKRSSLSDETFQQLILLKCNADINS